MLAGFRMSQDEIRLLIINPRTEQPISKVVLQKTFQHELTAGPGKLKMILGTRFIERVNAGDTHAILFGMRSIWGLRDDGDPAQLRLSMGGDGGRPQAMRIEFVHPRRRPDDDDGPLPLPAPSPRQNVIDVKPNQPSSGVPFVPLRRSWMD
jgi:hypothetical protein